MDANTSGAAFFARLSTDLLQLKDEVPTLQRVVDRAVEVVGPCDWCGISIRKRKDRVETVAASSRVARVCDALQYELGEGPCLEAIWDTDCYLTHAAAADRRWPRWGPRVAKEGVGAVLSIPLVTENETLGALNLYSARPHAFLTDDVDLALVFAAHATNAMSTARLVTGLQTAVRSRHLIGVAQGILMTRYELTMDQSFEVLRRFSSHANIKLRDLAAVVVETRRLPGVDPDDMSKSPSPPGDTA
jgi:GAF domain-containing protein